MSLWTFDFGGSFVRLGEISLGVRTGSSPQERRKREDTGNKVAIGSLLCDLNQGHIGKRQALSA